MFEEVKMTERSEWAGLWWFPDSEKRYSGVLRVDPLDRSSVEIALEPLELFTRIDSIEFLHGEINGTNVTLKLTGGFTANSKKTTINIDQVFFGGHFQSFKQIEITEVIFKMKNLAAWTKSSSLDSFFETGQQPPPFAFTLAGTQGEVSYNYPLDKYTESGCGIETGKDEYCQVALKYQLTKGSIEVFNEVENFAKLMTLLLYQTCFPLSVCCRTKEGKWISLYYKSSSFTSLPIKDYKDPLVLFKRLKNNFSSVMENWAIFFKKERYLTYNLIIQIQGRNSFLEDAFMHVVSSLEAYHRKYYEEKPPSAERKKFLDKVDAILGKIPELKDLTNSGERRSLKKYIESQREHTLKERLDEIINDNLRLANDFSKINTGKCAVTRNYIAHIDKEGKEVFSPIEMQQVTKQLAMLLAVCILKEIGVEESVYVDILRKKSQQLFH